MIVAGKQCETMATELLALAAVQDSAGRILTASDRRNTEFLDVLIENEQKEVIAHTVVQRYLQVSQIIAVYSRYLVLSFSQSFEHNYYSSKLTITKQQSGIFRQKLGVYMLRNLTKII